MDQCERGSTPQEGGDAVASEGSTKYRWEVILKLAVAVQVEARDNALRVGKAKGRRCEGVRQGNRDRGGRRRHNERDGERQPLLWPILAVSRVSESRKEEITGYGKR